MAFPDEYSVLAKHLLFRRVLGVTANPSTSFRRTFFTGQQTDLLHDGCGVVIIQIARDFSTTQINVADASNRESLSCFVESLVCAAEDPLNPSMLSINGAVYQLEFHIRHSLKNRCGELAQLFRSVVYSAEGNILIEDISCEDGNHLLCIVGIPGCDPAVRGGSHLLRRSHLRNQNDYRCHARDLLHSDLL